MEGLRTALVAMHASSLAQPPMRPSGERPKPRQVTVVAEGVEIVEQRRDTSPVMSPVMAGAGAGAKFSEKLSTAASAAFGRDGNTRRIFFRSVKSLPVKSRGATANKFGGKLT